MLKESCWKKSKLDMINEKIKSLLMLGKELNLWNKQIYWLARLVFFYNIFFKVDMIDKALGFDAPVGRRKRPDTNSEAFLFIYLDLQIRNLYETLHHLLLFNQQQSKNFTRRNLPKLNKVDSWIKKLLLLGTSLNLRVDSLGLKKELKAKNKSLLLL